jgi:hypothetical protein
MAFGLGLDRHWALESLDGHRACGRWAAPGHMSAHGGQTHGGQTLRGSWAEDEGMVERLEAAWLEGPRVEKEGGPGTARRDLSGGRVKMRGTIAPAVSYHEKRECGDEDS